MTRTRNVIQFRLDDVAYFELIDRMFVELIQCCQIKKFGALKAFCSLIFLNVEPKLLVISEWILDGLFPVWVSPLFFLWIHPPPSYRKVISMKLVPAEHQFADQCCQKMRFHPWLFELVLYKHVCEWGLLCGIISRDILTSGDLCGWYLV